jgi:UDP-N-acetyl-D-mannosaminuronic acid dehydrogenase
MKVCVVGIGRVGLPLALYLASKGIESHGLDVDGKKVEMLKKGTMPFPEDAAGVLLTKTLGKSFFPTTEFSAVSKVDTIIMTVGTPVDEFLNPDFSQIHSSLDTLLPHLHEGQLLILRSTVSPGSTEHIKNYIESKSSYRIGKNLYLAYCPERIPQGEVLQKIDKIPEIVGSIDEESAHKAVAFFKTFKEDAYPTAAINAELLKLFTNMHRYINFSIANEFMVISEEWGANIYEIADLANRKYPPGGPKLPGFTAGPCFFKDGFFLLESMPFPDLIISAWKINETIPGYLIQKAKKMKSMKGAKCALLGMAFKANNDDQRSSLSHKIKKLLQKEMADVHMHDIFKDGNDFDNHIKGADFLIIATAHDGYKKPLGYYQKLIKKDAVVIDIWNVFKKNRVIFRCSDG